MPARHAPLIETAELQARLGSPGWMVFDCRHDLARPEAGEAAYREGHIPDAQFLHLDRDLAAPLTGKNGRHPLPDAAAFAALLTRAGVASDSEVVAYDDAGGMYASRLWWMLRWLGHPGAAVLNGGWQKWLAEGRPVSREAVAAKPAAAPFQFRLQPLAVDAATVLDSVRAGGHTLLDGRAADRYRGENETIDPVAGHIPGALNRPFKDNLDTDGRFKSAASLRGEFARVLGGAKPAEVAHYCGSGVSACHNVLAMEIAGLNGSLLYPGSWSEWIANPSRPVARGAESGELP